MREMLLCRSPLGRSLSCQRLEEADEMLRVFKAEALADLGDGKIVGCQQFLCLAHDSVVYEVFRGPASLCLDECAEVPRGETALVGEICNCR